MFSEGFRNFAFRNDNFDIASLKTFCSLLKHLPKDLEIKDFKSQYIGSFYQTMKELFVGPNVVVARLINKFYHLCRNLRGDSEDIRDIMARARICEKILGRRFYKASRNLIQVRNLLYLSQPIPSDIFKNLIWGVIELYQFFSNCDLVRNLIEELLDNIVIIAREVLIYLRVGNLIEKIDEVSLRELRDQNWKTYIGNALIVNEGVLKNKVIQVLNWSEKSEKSEKSDNSDNSEESAIVLVDNEVQVVDLDVMVNVAF
jgi:hypothetical protein